MRYWLHGPSATIIPTIGQQSAKLLDNLLFSLPIPVELLVADAGGAVANAARLLLNHSEVERSTVAEGGEHLSCMTPLQRPPHNTICIVVGKGNNGADGLVAGRLLATRGDRVSLFIPPTWLRWLPTAEAVAAASVDNAAHVPPSSLDAIAGTPLGRLRLDADLPDSLSLSLSLCLSALLAGATLHPWSAFTQLAVQQGSTDLVVDALFGFGFDASRALPDDHAAVLGAMAAFPGKVLCVDVPSGTSADGVHHPASLTRNLAAAPALISLTAPKDASHTVRLSQHFLAASFVPPVVLAAFNLGAISSATAAQRDHDGTDILTLTSVD